jgi:hypothetical protein
MDAAAERDRRLELPLYARGGNGEVWLVDLDAERVESHCSRSPDGYTERHIALPGDALTIAALDGLAVRVDDILG